MTYSTIDLVINGSASFNRYWKNKLVTGRPFVDKLLRGQSKHEDLIIEIYDSKSLKNIVNMSMFQFFAGAADNSTVWKIYFLSKLHYNLF